MGRTSSSRSRPPLRQREQDAEGEPETVTNITWKLVSGWPPRNWMATESGQARHRKRARSSDRPARCTSRMYGISGKMLVSGHGQPDDEEGPEREHDSRRAARRRSACRARVPSRKVPKAATNSLSIAITASDFQNGRTKRRHGEGREDRRLGVGQVRAPAHEVRDSRAGVAEAHRACTGSRAGTRPPRRPARSSSRTAARPAGLALSTATGPEPVRARQRAAGSEPLADQHQRQHGVDHRGPQHRMAAPPGGHPPEPPGGRCLPIDAGRRRRGARAHRWTRLATGSDRRGGPEGVVGRRHGVRGR